MLYNTNQLKYMGKWCDIEEHLDSVTRTLDRVNDLYKSLDGCWPDMVRDIPDMGGFEPGQPWPEVMHCIDKTDKQLDLLKKELVMLETRLISTLEHYDPVYREERQEYLESIQKYKVYLTDDE